MNRMRLTLALLSCLALATVPVAAQVADYRDIKYPTLPEFSIPKPTVFELGNGMTVFLLEDRELPLVSVSARIRTGSYWEPQDKLGLAQVVGQTMRSGGTTSMNGDAMDDWLAMRAASIETTIGGDSGFASMDCLAQDFDDVFKMFVDVLRNPAFPQDKIDLAKLQLNTAIARRNDDVNGIAGRELSRLVYGADSPLARTMEYATVAAIGRDDVVAFHANFYHSNNMYLGVVGDFDAKQMRKRIEVALGGWPKGSTAPTPRPSYRESANPGVWFIEKSDVTQASVGMAHLGIEIKNPDYFAAQVMNEVLGGGFAARMFSNIRSKKGLAYSVGGGLGAANVHPGLFRASMQTKSASVFDAIDALKTEIRGIIDTPPSKEELNRAKEAILNSFVFNYDSREEVLQQQMNNAFYGLPADFLEIYRSRIEKVTGDEVARVAAKYVKPDALTVLVVGKESDFGKPMETLGEVTRLDIAIPPPPDTGVKVEKTAASLEAGRRIMEKIARSLGGPTPEKTRAIRTTGSMALSMQGASITIAQSVLLVFPDRVRQTMQTPMGEQTLIVTPDEAFAVRGGAAQPLPDAMVQSVRRDLNRDLRMLVRYHDDPGLEAVAAGQESCGEARCDVVQVTFGGTTSRLWVGADGLVLKQSYQGEQPLTRAPGTIEVEFSDYREIGGRQVPHRQTIAFEGETTATMTLENFEVDPEIDPATFAKPQA